MTRVDAFEPGPTRRRPHEMTRAHEADVQSTDPKLSVKLVAHPSVQAVLARQRAGDVAGLPAVMDAAWLTGRAARSGCTTCATPPRPSPTRPAPTSGPYRTYSGTPASWSRPTRTPASCPTSSAAAPTPPPRSSSPPPGTPANGSRRRRRRTGPPAATKNRHPPRRCPLDHERAAGHAPTATRAATESDATHVAPT